MLKNLGCTRLLVSAAYMPIENERILVQCKYIKNIYVYYWALTCVSWSGRWSWLQTSSLVLGWDISLEFSSWVSATDIFVLGYIRLLCPVLGVTSYKVSIAYLSQYCQSQTLIYSNVSLPNYCSLICGGRRESTRLINEPVVEK